jgi:hypothetical protein
LLSNYFLVLLSYTASLSGACIRLRAADDDEVAGSRHPLCLHQEVV